MKKFTFLLFLTFFCTTFLSAQSGNFSVQVGAFDYQPNEDYFKALDNVMYHRDRNDIHRYHIIGLGSREAAEAEAVKARKLGFNAVVVDIDEKAKNCRIICDNVEPDSVFNNLNWLFFDFDQAFLRPTSMAQLDRLIEILQRNPGFKVEFSSHTDDKGTNEYNQALSLRRATNAINYQAARGVIPTRFKVIARGEEAPIAKNMLANGFDSEEGRQYNRRIEIRIFDSAGKQLNMVDSPRIPTELQTETAASFSYNTPTTNKISTATVATVTAAVTPTIARSSRFSSGRNTARGKRLK